MDHHASKIKGLMWIGIACLLGAAFALGLSPLAHGIPFRWEKRIASVLGSDSIAQECRSGLQAQALLKQLVTRIYPVTGEDASFGIDVRIVKSTVVNAYAQLGGKISVNSGLLKQAQSPEELAGILAHEIGHVQHRDILQGVITHMLTAEGISMIFSDGQSSAGDWAKYFLNMSFTRSQEALADEAGLQRLQKAHVDNRGFKQFFERMEKTESGATFLSDHPSSQKRLEMAEKFENQDVEPIMTQDEWKVLKAYCGEK